MTLVEQLRLAVLAHLNANGGQGYILKTTTDAGYRAIAELIAAGLAYDDTDAAGRVILCITRAGLEALEQ